MSRPVPHPLRVGAVAALALTLVAGCGLIGKAKEAANAHEGAAERSVETAGGAFVVEWAPTPDPIPLNELFDLAVTVTRADGSDLADDARIRVDGRMPQHGHGMNVRPEVVTQTTGSYRIDGMLFHMPGEWTISFDVFAGDKAQRATVTVPMEPR